MTEICKKHDIDHTGTFCGSCVLETQQKYEILKKAIHQASFHLRNNRIVDIALIRSIIYDADEAILKSK